MQIKICGITNESDARAALALGVDWLGFNFYRNSPRYVAPDIVADILDKVECACKSVGIFVNSDREDVEAISSRLGLAAVQLHGDEEPADFAGFHVPLWRAIRISDGKREPLPESWAVDRYVVDARVEGAYGGTGRKADWDDALVLATEHPVMLSGGLGPGNVVDAIERVKPLGVDVASGIESAPGVKDHDLMAKFVSSAREVSEGL